MVGSWLAVAQISRAWQRELDPQKLPRIDKVAHPIGTQTATNQLLGLIRSSFRFSNEINKLLNPVKMPPEYFPLRWESTGDQWWYASPIDCAAANGLYNIVRELLQLDSNLLIKLTSLRRISRLETVWDAEFDDVARCRAHVARQLLHESDNNRRSGKRYNSLIRGGYGGWLMYTAASASDVDFVKELLGIDPLMVFGEGEYGVTDILYAAARSKNSEVFRLLLDIAMSPKSCLNGGGDVLSEGGLSTDVDPRFKSEMMNRAVQAAARGGNMEVLKELLEGCSDVMVYRDAQGSTLLHTASGRGQVEVVKYLIESYDIVSARDNEGNTALHVAAYRGFSAVVDLLLLSCHSLAFAVNNHGDTFLHFAVAGFRTLGFRRIDHQIELMKQLVSSKIIDIGEEDIINIKNKDGRTALHVAVSENIQNDLVELLMTVPFINLSIRDLGGMTPLDLLRRRPKSASSEILIKRLISAGGISNAQDVKARSALASHLREGLSLSTSPGTSFRIPDAEIFLYAGIEKSRSTRNHGYSSSVDYSRCLSENDVKVSTPSPLKRLKCLFRRKLRKSSRSEFRHQESLNSTNISRSFGYYPISLRQQYCSKESSSSPNSISKHKRIFSDTYRNSFPSTSSRKKFSTNLTPGGIQPKTRFSNADSCPSSGESSVFPPVVRNAQFSGPLQPSKNRGSLVKRLSMNKSLMNPYVCFGAQNLGTEDNRVVMV